MQLVGLWSQRHGEVAPGVDSEAGAWASDQFLPSLWKHHLQAAWARPRQRICFCLAQGLAINRMAVVKADRSPLDMTPRGHATALPLCASRRCRCLCIQSRSTSFIFMTTLGLKQKLITSSISAAALIFVL